MEKIDDKFKLVLDEFIKLYKYFQPIILIATCEVFLKDNITNLQRDQLILDTIKVIKNYDYDFKILLDSNDYCDFTNDNLFVLLSNMYKNLQNSDIIENYFSEKSYDIPKTKGVKQKKSYEVEVLSDYLRSIIINCEIHNVIEMGCGKAYLTEKILQTNDQIRYIGIDKKEELVLPVLDQSKRNKELNKQISNIIENIIEVNNSNKISINYFVTVKNFNELYEKSISSKLNKTSNNKVLLLGLHSCGNLTSDSFKIFSNHKCFSHIVIIGCCLHALKEYITPTAKDSKIFKNYIENMGYDGDGNLLEETLLYNYDFNEIGYPISNYLLNEHADLFLSRVARNSSMMTFPPNNHDMIVNSKDKLYCKKLIYRSALQAYFECYMPELKNIYAFRDVKIKLEDNFFKYLNVVLDKFEKVRPNHIRIVNIFNEQTVVKFFDSFTNLEDIFWAVYLIRLKFSKIIEYIVAFDRIVYLRENDIKNVKILRIFDEKKSVRNLMIYAEK